MVSITLIIFLLALFVIELSLRAYRTFQNPDRAEVRKRLREVNVEEGEEVSLTKRRVMSEVPFLNRVLPLLPGASRMDLLVKQANLQYTLGFFCLSSLCLAVTVHLAISILTRNAAFAVAAALLAGALPFFYVRMKKVQRMAIFEKQLPDGLGLIARALRAGHAFTSGMKLAADEFGDPLGTELQETLDEINFGVNVPEALKNLARRVDCPDLGFFVVSVILQRETGGNLSEIIENLAHLMRERFKFRGKVRTLSAEGRLSAVVLLLIPFVLFAILFLMNRSYVDALMSDPIGKSMIGAAAFMMTIGVIMIKRIIKVEV